MTHAYPADPQPLDTCGQTCSECNLPTQAGVCPSCGVSF